MLAYVYHALGTFRSVFSRHRTWLIFSNSRSALTSLYDLCQKALSVRFLAPAGAFDTPCTARIEARHDSLQLLSSTWVELRHR